MTWYRFEPIGDVWENPTPASKRRSRYTFKAGYNNTLTLLRREIELLDPNRPWGRTDVVLQVACSPGDVNRDGGLSARARAFGHPGVRVSFKTQEHGLLTYGTDVCELWQHNVRAITLGLEALRAVARHGIANSGQQYTGFKALPAGRAMPASHMTSDEAYALLERVAVGEEGEVRARYLQLLRTSPETLRDCFNHARKTAHPDHRDGDRTVWDQVEEAGKILGLVS